MLLLLMLSTWGNIRWRFRLPGKVGMIPPVRIIGVTIWSIC